MQSNSIDSEGRITKATEVLWKFWWFCFYLIIAPFIVSLIIYFIFLLIIGDVYIVMGFSVIAFMFSLLFFYKAFDKYREKPFFKNKENNLIARINILFLITIVSLIITPIFIFITPKDYTFELLPLISFCVLYNIVWYYYYYQPIDIYSQSDREFKQLHYFKTSIKQFHNLIIFVNFFVQIVFLSVIYYTKISWLFALITNIIFYLFTLIYTTNQRNQIKTGLQEGKPIIQELIKFQRKFVVLIQGLIFSILIQIPIIIVLVPLPDLQYTSLLLTSFVFLIVLFMIFYFKTRFYVFFYYGSKLETATYNEVNKPEESVQEKNTKYQRYNTFLTGGLIIVFIIFAFLVNLLALILILLPFVYTLSYFEQKAEFTQKYYDRYVYLLNTIAILAIISFGFLPLISEIFQINVQLMIFCLSFYFILEIFVQFRYFLKESIRMIQNILAVASFFLIAYLFYPLIFLEYIIFTTDPNLILLSAIFLNSIIFLIVLLISFYRFYSIFKAKNSLKIFNICIFINLFLIDLFLIILINMRAYFLVDFNIFLNILVLSTILFPVLLLLFLSIHYLIGVISYKNFLDYVYYTCWFLILAICLSIGFVYYDFMIMILLDLLILSTLIHFQVIFGQKLEKISESTVKKFIHINSYILTFELFCLFFSIFYTVFNFLLIFDNLIVSAYLSSVIISVLINILSKKVQIFSRSICIKITIFILSFSSVLAYYFLFLLTQGTVYMLIIPIIFTSIIVNFLIYYIKKNKFFPESTKKVFILNNLLLSASIILIPTFIGLDLYLTGFEVDIFLIILSTAILIFGFLKFLDYFARYIELKDLYIIHLKSNQIFIWIFITFLTLIDFIFIFIFSSRIFQPFLVLIVSTSLFIFFALNIYSLKQISDLTKFLSKNKELALKHLKFYRFYENYRNIIFFGLILSFSFLFTSLIQFSNILGFLSSELEFLNAIWYVGFFFSFVLIITVISDTAIKMKFSRLREYLKLISWMYIKIFFPLFLAIYAFPFSIFNKITLFILIFSLLTPITLHLIKQLRINLEEYQILVRKILKYMFIFSILSFYIELFIFFTFNEKIPLFYNNPLILITLIAGNLFLIASFCFLKYEDFIETESEFKIYRFYGLAGSLFFSLLYFNPLISLWLIPLSFLIVLYKRNKNVLFRIILISLLSYVAYIQVIVFFDTYGVLSAYEPIPNGFYVLIYLASIISVLSSSIILNMGKNNILERFSLYGIIPLFSFVSFLTYTSILIIYNISISLFLFLLVVGIDFYRIGDARYKWFIKPCILLFVFDFISWISYSFLFISPDYTLINPTLTFTLTASTTGVAFIFLYNKAPEKFRTQSFYVALTSIIFYIPIFIYFFLISYFPIHLQEPIPLLIAFNFGILIFYLSVGIYQWKLSWAIWKTGWWVWNLLPIVNFIIIYNIVTGINIITNVTNILGDLDVLIITVIICTFIELPALYTWIKHHFYRILLVIWGESLFLVYYISLNLYIGNFALINLSFILFSTILLMPLIYQLRLWNILSKMWLLLAGINTLFLSLLMTSIGITNLGIIISIGVLILGSFFLVYSFFPNIRNQGLIVVISYFTIITGIFLTILNVLFSIILNLFISINIAFIIMGFSLFSSKYLKLNRKYTNLIASWILISNFSLLTFNTFSLIPGMELFAIFLAVTVFGGSFFVFNHYKIIGPINKGIPWMFMGFGLASSISSLFIIFLQVSLILMSALFTTIFLAFLYIILDEYKYLMLYLIPVPLAFLVLDFILMFAIFQPVAILMWLFLYIGFFQIIINSFDYFLKEQKTKIEDKNLINFFKNKKKTKAINLTCLIINSTYLSLVIVIVSYTILIYQILLFLIIWPVLLLFCLKYFKTSELDSIFPDFNAYVSKISFILYLLPPIAISVNIFLSLMLLVVDIIFLILIPISIFTGILFLEIFIIDNKFFKYLIEPIRKQLTFYTWVFFCNIVCYYLYSIHSNPFLFLLSLSLLNLVTIHFLNQLPIKNKENISKSRLVLIYIILLTSSFYIASLITDIIVIYYRELSGFPLSLFFFFNSVMILFILNIFFNIKIKLKLKDEIQFALFLLIQILLFTVYWIFITIVFNLVNFFSISLIILIETCLSYVSIYYFAQILSKEKRSNFISKLFSLITLFVYLELSFMFFGLSFEFLGLFESILISQIIMFALTLSDIHFIKKLKKSLGYFIHTISFIVISYFLFQFLIQYMGQSLYFLSLTLLIFISLQFYTLYSIFSTLNNVYPDKTQSFKVWKTRLQKSLGTIFYFLLMFFIFNAFNLAQIEILLLILIISFIIHGLMYADQLILKFLGKLSGILKIFSWISIMVLSSIYLSDLFTFSAIIIPVIIFLLTIEINYLFQLLKNSQFISSNEQKIKRVIIIIFYINFITWPLYFATSDAFLILNLSLFSIGIFYILTYIDNYLSVFKEKFRMYLRKYLFLTIAILLSTDIFILLATIVPPINLFLNLSICALIFLVFAVFIVKPFKEHSIVALAYWNTCFFFISIIFYYIFLSLQISLFFFLITFVIYWFIFALERFREFFRMFIEYLTHLIKNINYIIIHACNSLLFFLKRNFKPIWIVISIFISLNFAILIYPFLGLFHLILITLAIFGLLYSIIPSEKSADPDEMFSRKMKRLIILWGGVIGFIFSFIPIAFMIPAIFISILILGAILEPYIYYKEKKENISIKWRFYSILFFIIILIITGIMAILQISGLLF